MNALSPDFTKNADGLVPAVIQDSVTSKVLMLGYMNQDALDRTCQEKRVTFFSRSKNRLWTKGEESGHFLEVVEILADCDRDTLLIKAIPAGPICHTGSDTCFDEKNESEDFLKGLEGIIQDRKSKSSSESYTRSLFEKGINKIAQKVGEEAVELVIEAKDDNPDLFKNEAADLLFHYLVLLNAKGFRLNDVIEVLRKRHQS
ncbi:MAG TPA: bifunctional phosphoribosyl-AMP cyclohydrolase/phosphoribosyl-ATP diphosphatase HisIE [Bacteroidia bacterium]|jgi:phosphoribosyl-ATP pyrophosphohydrolase/phosphoribosyl-AMP cyclohydrolase|nr:bifunctional phosphoribosyl-AMP cyclohydrolase/phosphoribosyl-ATP diphosphatase HisIE [Bacteroidia bacterium]